MRSWLGGLRTNLKILFSKAKYCTTHDSDPANSRRTLRKHSMVVVPVSVLPELLLRMYDSLDVLRQRDQDALEGLLVRLLAIRCEQDDLAQFDVLFLDKSDLAARR